MTEGGTVADGPTTARGNSGVIGDSAFDRAVAVTLDSADEGGATHTVDLDDTWVIGERPHGGYLIAVLGSAARDTLRVTGAAHQHPLSTSTIFLRSPVCGPAQVTSQVRRSGRSASHVHTTLSQDGQPCVEALSVFGTISADTEPWFIDEPTIAVPPWDVCASIPRAPTLPDGTTFRIGIAEVTDMRVDPALLEAMVSGSTPTGKTNELQAWLHFSDGRDHDPLSLLFILDAMPPVTFAMGLAGWVPTLELTTYIRAVPAPGPLLVRPRARLITDGRLDEVCDVWDATGRLVAQGTQLAGVRTG